MRKTQIAESVFYIISYIIYFIFILYSEKREKEVNGLGLDCYGKRRNQWHRGPYPRANTDWKKMNSKKSLKKCQDIRIRIRSIVYHTRGYPITHTTYILETGQNVWGTRAGTINEAPIGVRAFVKMKENLRDCVKLTYVHDA